jgi:tRNA-specific 2-thiouridylase
MSAAKINTFDREKPYLQEGSLLNTLVPADGKINYLPNPNNSKIAVAMSGGVDSSVALYLLKEAGYDVVGITAWIISGSGRCCDNGVVDAVKVCDQLGVEHHAIDLRKDFAEGIIKEFHESYAQGETPIPCISCNNDIKWGSLLSYSLSKLGATHLASGHYAKIVQDENGLHLYRPQEENKDQSYMLWGLTPQQLSATVFPLADLDKSEVRKIANDSGLCVASKPESQDICFVSNGMTNSDYLLKILGEKPGNIIEIDSGKILGQHKGSFNYTYGQRKGLGIAHSEPLYVVKIDSKSNSVFVGTKDKLAGQVAKAKNRNLINNYLGDDFEALVKIRYNSDPTPARVKLCGDNEIEVEFYEPVTAITPGQALAIYDLETGLELIGGAWIC